MLSTLIEQYCAESRADCLLSSNTVHNWGAALRRFSHWVGPAVGLDAVNPDNYQAYKRERLRRVCASTARVDCQALRAFGRWLVAKRLLERDPFAGLPLPHRSPSRRRLTTEAEVSDLLAATLRIANERRAALARGVLSVYLYSGLRRSECLDIRLQDVAFTQAGALIQTVGKGQNGGKARVVPVPKVCADSIRAWLRVRGECRHTYLWDYDHSRRLGHRGLTTLIDELNAIAGLRESPIKPHTIRHFYATHLSHQPGVSLDDVRELLGHSRLTTTQTYVHASLAHLQEVARRAALEPAEQPSAPESRQDARRASRWRRRQVIRAA